MDVTQWINARRNNPLLIRRRNERFPGFATEQEMFILYPLPFVQALQKRLPELRIKDIDYTIENKRIRYEFLQLSGTYRNWDISTEFELLSSDEDCLLIFLNSHHKNQPEIAHVLTIIREECHTFFEQHSYSRLDIMMHAYRKEFNF